MYKSAKNLTSKLSEDHLTNLGDILTTLITLRPTAQQIYSTRLKGLITTFESTLTDIQLIIRSSRKNLESVSKYDLSIIIAKFELLAEGVYIESGDPAYNLYIALIKSEKTIIDIQEDLFPSD